MPEPSRADTRRAAPPEHAAPAGGAAPPGRGARPAPPPPKPAEPDDPMALVGVAVPAGPAALTEMAYVVAEEFASLGFDETRLLRLFRTAAYAGPHRAYRALGEPAVRAIIAECLAARGRRPEGG